MSSSFWMRARALCDQSSSTLPLTCSSRAATASRAFQPSSGEDSVSNGKILALMPASEGVAENSGDLITTLSEPDKGVDWLHGPGPSYGNDGCIDRAGLVSESCPFGVVLHDEGSKARNEPEAKVVSIVVIKWDKRAYNSRSEMEESCSRGKPTGSGRTLMRSEKTWGKNCAANNEVRERASTNFS